MGSNPTLSASFARLMRGLLVLLSLTVVAACARAPAPERFHGQTMGTTYSITVAALPDGATRDTLQAAVDEVLDGSNAHLSTYDPTSELSRFNASASTDWIEVSQPLYEVIAIAQEVSAATDGAFDVTVGPLVKRWGFGGGSETAPAPDPGELARLRESVGYARLELREPGRRLRKTAGALQVDVGAIAPGWAVDEIARRFESLGVDDYLVELGGEVRGRGLSPAGRPWRVAVEAPLAGERRPYALVELDGMGVSTSGDYRDFRIVDGRTVSHTIDPGTGAPVAHALASVCVLHPSTARADAYATALMVLGPEEGLELAERLGLAALFIERSDADGKFRERSTAAFERLRRALD